MKKERVKENALAAGSVEPGRAARTPQRVFIAYLLLPFLFLTVTLLGGIRLSGTDNSLIFLKPSLFSLMLGTICFILFFRGGLIDSSGWFSDDKTAKNIANLSLLFAIFTATVQTFNSLLPENGLPFWVMAFCFVWALWNQLFTGPNSSGLLGSIAGMFGFAFAAKYLLLAKLTAPASEGWLSGIIEHPTKEAFTWLFELPRYSEGTGYIQFLSLLLCLLGLYMMTRSTGHRALLTKVDLNNSTVPSERNLVGLDRTS
ncbi:MAG: hypothetical protein WBD22_05820 [Pyrinomonadaceae bacterium]